MSNITVAVRVRPLIARELRENLPIVWNINGVTMYPIDPVTQKPGNERYVVDQIYPEELSTRDIYLNLAKPILDAVVNGYNGTIFAYGQTSSGKTYTMMGDISSNGIIQLAINDIFELIENVRDRKYLLRCQYMELYNDKLFDLLNNNKEVKIREPESGEVRTDAKEILIDSASMLLEVMEEGTKARKVGETKANEKSSRSHAVFRIVMESKFVNDEIVAQVGQLNLVDLAGSERASVTTTGTRLKEGAQINKSLSTLGLVIKQLTDGQEYVNFRDSKLTRLLEPSLGGNALTAIICAVTPAALEETHSTLAFACRAKGIKNKPIVNIVENSESSLLNKLTMEIKNLNEKLQKASTTSQEQDVLNKILVEKVTFLEKRLIYRSRLLEKKKKDIRRRKTWAGASLPVINEGATWEPSRVSDPAPVPQPPQEPERENANRDDEQPGPLNAPQGQGDEQPASNPAQNPPEEDDDDDTCEYDTCDDDTSEDDLNSTGDHSAKVLQWLVDGSVATPRSVLKQRAAYYEEEYKSLQELTSVEQKFLKEEVGQSLKELQETVQFLETEREKREHECSIFKQEIKHLETEIASQNTHVNELQEHRKSQSCTYLKELCDQKAVLSNLREQLMALHTSCGPEAIDRLNDVVKMFEAKIDDLSNIVSNLDGQKELPQDFQPAILLLKSICEQCTEVEQSLSELPEEVVGFFRIFKSLCDLVTELLILMMMKQDKHPCKMICVKKSDEKIQKLKAVITVRDSEIEDLSDKIMEYLAQLEDTEEQVAKIKAAKDRKLTAYFLKIETLKEKCLNITRITNLKIKMLKDEVNDWKSKYEAVEKEVGMKMEEEMEHNVICEEKNDLISDLKTNFQLLQSRCEHSLRKFNFVDTENPLTIDEVIDGLNIQECHIVHLQAIVADLKQKMEEKHVLHLPTSDVDCVETNRIQAQDEEIQSLSEALRYQSVQLEEYRNILAPSDKPQTRSVVYYLEKQSVDLNELKCANEVLQKKNLTLLNDSETKNELIKQQTDQIQQLKSQTLELVNNAQNTGTHLNKQESTTAELQVALEKQALAIQEIGLLEIDLERKDVLLKQIKDHFSTRAEKDEINDIFELKDNDTIQEKQMRFESMISELNIQNNRVDDLKKLIQVKDSMIMNIILERDKEIQDRQEMQLQYNDLETQFKNTTTETIGLRCALQNQLSLTTTIQAMTTEIQEKNKTIEDLTKVPQEKHHFECLTIDQETKRVGLEGELAKVEADNNELVKKVELLSHDLSLSQNLMEKKNEAFETQKGLAIALQHSLTAKNESIQKQEQELQILKNDLCDKDRAIKFVENIVKQKEEVIMSEQNKIRELQESINARKTDKIEHTESLEEDKDEAAPEVESLAILCEELREARNEAVRAKDSMVMRCDELSEKIKHLTKQLAEKDEALGGEGSLAIRFNELSEKLVRLTAEFAEKNEELRVKGEELRRKESLAVHCDELCDKVKRLTLELHEKEEALRGKESLTMYCDELSEKIRILSLESVDKEVSGTEKKGEHVNDYLAIRCDELSQEIKRLNVKLSEKDQLHENTKELIREKESLLMNCEDLSEKINILTVELFEKDGHLQTIEAMMYGNEQKFKFEQNVNKTLRETFSEFNERVDNLTMEINDKDEKTKNLQTLLDQKEELFKTSRAEHLLEISSKDKSVETMQSLLEQKDTTLKSQQDTVSGLQESLTKLTNVLESREIEAQKLNHKITNLELDMNHHEVALEEQMEEIKKLKSIVEKQGEIGNVEMHNKANDLLQKLAVRDEEIKTFHDLLEQKNAALEQLQASISHLQETNEKSKQTLEEKDSQINELTSCKTASSKLQTKMNALLNQYNALKGGCKARENENEGLKAEVTRLRKADTTLEEHSQTWKAQYALTRKENDDLLAKIEGQKIKDANTQKQMTVLQGEIQRQKNKCQNIALELEDIRRRNTAMTEDNKLAKGALESASDSIQSLKLERMQIDTEKNRLEENLKVAKIEIIRRLRERDLLKRELRNTQFDASRNLQDAQTETEDLPKATGRLSSKSPTSSLDVASSSEGGTPPEEEEPRQFKSLPEEVAFLTEKIKTMEHKYRALRKVCIMRKKQIDALINK